MRPLVHARKVVDVVPSTRSENLNPTTNQTTTQTNLGTATLQPQNNASSHVGGSSLVVPPGIEGTLVLQQIPAIITSPTPPSSTTTQHKSPQNTGLLSVEPILPPSRDSRITLPDDARQYIVSVPDSSLPSINPDAASTVVNPLKQDLIVSQSPETGGLVPQLSSVSELDSPTRKSEFLDLDSDMPDDEDESVPERDDDWEIPSRHAPSSESPPTAHLRPHSHVKKNRSHHAAEEDSFLFPHGADQRAESDYHSGNSGIGSNVSSSTNLSASNNPDTKPPSMPFRSDPSRDPVPASFRALPLLSSDLPYTSIVVSNSVIKPNERGKEVLSFVISINPGKNKESWKVEKVYSDILTLDQRVRNNVGKTAAKRIATLPEGKFWKDHAPARVDQRKVCIVHHACEKKIIDCITRQFWNNISRD